MRSSPRYDADHSSVQRDCALYYIYVLDPRTNYTTITLGYVGETGRRPFTRFLEHLYDQPFGDTIVGMPEVDPRVFPDKVAVLAAERATVERLRPLYNYEWNLDNPHRIPVYEARCQRAERDAARGRPSNERWTGERRSRRRPSAPTGSAPASRRLSVRVALLWLVLSAVLWVGVRLAAGSVGLPLPAEVGATVGAVGGAVLVGQLRRWRRR